MAHTITLIPGDGIGPEIADATVRVLDATGVGFEWEKHEGVFELLKGLETPYLKSSWNRFGATGWGNFPRFLLLPAPKPLNIIPAPVRSAESAARSLCCCPVWDPVWS